MIWDKTRVLWKKAHMCTKKQISDNSSYFLLRVYYVLDSVYILYIISLEQS